MGSQLDTTDHAYMYAWDPRGGRSQAPMQLLPSSSSALQQKQPSDPNSKDQMESEEILEVGLYSLASIHSHNRLCVQERDLHINKVQHSLRSVGDKAEASEVLIGFH